MTMPVVLVIGCAWLVLDMQSVSTAANLEFAVAGYGRCEEAGEHEAGMRPSRPPAEIRGMDISSMIIIAVAVVVAVIALRLDDPIGEELDRIRSRNQLLALQTPLFHSAD